jgi:dienelactone hydrolase
MTIKKIVCQMAAVIFTLLMCISVARSHTLDTHSRGRIEFDSYTTSSMFDLVRERRKRWVDQKIWGDLTFPKNINGKVPAIILAHGSAGVGRHINQWVTAFNEIGIATFVVDSFGPRNIKSMVSDQNQLSNSSNLMDAFKALQLLSTHPNIDKNKIGIMGFSKGGEVAFRAAIEPFRSAVIKSELRFALHIPTYPGCNQVYWSDNVTKAPILNLLGAADDYTTAEPCKLLAKRYANAGSPIRTIEYANAHHGFDALIKLTWFPDAITANACGIVNWDIPSWTITSLKSGIVLKPSDLQEFFSSCSKRGAHSGRNEKAYLQAREDVQVFVRSVFFNNK